MALQELIRHQIATERATAADLLDRKTQKHQKQGTTAYQAQRQHGQTAHLE